MCPFLPLVPVSEIVDGLYWRDALERHAGHNDLQTGTNGGNGHERALRCVSGVLLAWLLFEPQRQFLQLELALLNLQLRADQVEHPGNTRGSLPLDPRRTLAR